MKKDRQCECGQPHREVDPFDWHVRIQPRRGLPRDVEHRIMHAILSRLEPYELADQVVVEICAELPGGPVAEPSVN